MKSKYKHLIDNFKLLFLGKIMFLFDFVFKWH